MSRIDRQLQCEKCGSVYFQPADFQQYYRGYATSPGGELYPVEGPRVSVRVCLCGHPIPRSTTLDSKTRRSFESSLASALAFRATCEPAALRKHFVNKYACREELVRLQAALVNLETIVEKRQNALASGIASGIAVAHAKGAGEESSRNCTSNAVTRAGRRRKAAKPRRKR